MTQAGHQSSSLERALTEEMRSWSERGLERVLRAAWHRTGAEVETQDGLAVDFSSNDYLGLAADPRLVRAAAGALESEGVGASASRLIAGNHPEHDALERDIAVFFDAPAALAFNSGFAANTGAIPALVAGGDAIFADAFNHASLIDGCRLSRAAVHVYAHSDMAELRALLAEHRAPARRALVVSDGLFSMDGDLANFREITALAHEYDAWTYIDDAHAVGAIGPGGQGTAAHFGLHGAADITMGTLGKSFGASGAFVYGSDVLRRHLLNRARSFVFSTAFPPAVAAAARASLAIVRDEPERRERLRENVRHVREALTGAGAQLGGVDTSHIVPIVVGDTAETMRIGAALRAQGILVGAVRPPTVAAGSSRLRISVSAAHTSAQSVANTKGRRAVPRSGWRRRVGRNLT